MADTTARTCSSCGTSPAGPGGILCPDCKARIEADVPWPLATGADDMARLTHEDEPDPG